MHRGTREFWRYSSLENSSPCTRLVGLDPRPSRPKLRGSLIHEDVAQMVDLS